MISQQVSELAVRIIARGAPTDPAGSVRITPPTNIPDAQIGEIITRVINWGLSIAGSVAVLFLIVGGIMYITSAGDSQRIEDAKKTLKNAIIGVVFILISLVIVNTINFAITGVNSSGSGTSGGATVGTP